MIAPPPQIALSGHTKGLVARLLLNGTPLLVDERGDGNSLFSFANVWAKPGRNLLELRLAWPASQPFVPGQGRAEVAVKVVRSSDDIAAAPDTVRVDWPNAQTPEGYPQTFRREFSTPDAAPVALWTDLESIDGFSDADRTAVIRVVSQFYDAYASGNVERVLELQAFKTRDFAIAFGEQFDAREQRIRALTQRLVSASRWTLLPLASDRLEMEIVAERRLVWVTKPSYRPVLQTPPLGDFAWTNEIYVGRKQGTWLVAR